jgi:hypothetical protein
MASSTLQRYRDTLVGMKLTHTWRGHGSAIFLEFGALAQRMRLDGSPGETEGELGVMVQWSWRIEGGHSIICGSWSDDDLWEPALLRLQSSTVENLDVFGKLPELAVALSNGHSVVSFMTSEGDPQWALFDRRSPTRRWLCVRDGRLIEETSAAQASAP